MKNLLQWKACRGLPQEGSLGSSPAEVAGTTAALLSLSASPDCNSKSQEKLLDDSLNRLCDVTDVWMLVVFEEFCIGSSAVTVFLCISFQELIEFSGCIDLALDNSDL